MKNMRNVGKMLDIQKTITVQEVGVVEEISQINHYLADEYLSVTTRLYNSDEELLQEDVVVISGDLYAKLLSDSDEFEQGKQSGTYRESDIWKIVDKIRG